MPVIRSGDSIYMLRVFNSKDDLVNSLGSISNCQLKFFFLSVISIKDSLIQNLTQCSHN